MIDQDYLQNKIDDLMDFIYTNGLELDFQQFSPYHFRIKNKIDVWPSTQKVYVKGMSGSKTYESAKEIINYL